MCSYWPFTCQLWHIAHFVSLFFCTFFYVARIGLHRYVFGCHYYPTNCNSLGHCICVHQGKLLATAYIYVFIYISWPWVVFATLQNGWNNSLNSAPRYIICTFLWNSKHNNIHVGYSCIRAVSATLQSARYASLNFGPWFYVHLSNILDTTIYMYVLYYGQYYLYSCVCVHQVGYTYRLRRWSGRGGCCS